MVARPDNLESIVADLLRRVGDLETAERLTNAAMTDGRIRVLDSAGTVRLEIGLLSTGEFGINAFNADGVRTFTVGDNGLVRPAMILAPFDTFDLAPPRSTTGASFGSLFQANAPFVVADGFAMSVNVGSDVGTTGELRVQIVSASGNVTSSVFSITSGLGGGGGGTGPKVLKWTHGLTLGQNDLTVGVQVQLRRTGGAGNVYAAVPTYVYFVDSEEFGCTGAGGTWS